MKNGWQIKQLGELCKTIQDGAHRSPQVQFTTPGVGRYLYITSKNIRTNYLDLANVSYVDAEFHDDIYPRCKPEVGDVLLTKDGANTGNVTLNTIDEPFSLLSSVCLIKTEPSLLVPAFLCYFIQSPEGLASITGEMTGAAIKRIILRTIKLATIPLPPLAEQRRIVGILDEAFEGLANAKANAEQNLQNARALFESHLQAVFTQRGDGWDRMTLETLLERGWIEDHMDGNHGGDYPRKEEFISEGVPYISANCLDGERVDMSRAKFLSPSRAALLRKGFAKDNDVLFAHNATVGPVTILHTDEEKVILGTSLTYYRCNRAHILPEYLAHYMRSFGFKTQYLQVMRQSTRNQVPITKQREFFHVVPPLDEQKAIIGQLDGLLENGQRLESLYQRKLAALDELKKSLLHRAFSGQL